MPRIISGKVGGLLLKTLKGKNTRPTSDRTKEAMFSAITSIMSLEKLNVLDLFAGSGQLGLEALSRGAASLTAVEHNKVAVEVIKENAKHCRLDKELRIIMSDYKKACAKLVTEGKNFDLILLDPPYDIAEKVFAECQTFFCEKALLASSGLIVLESSWQGRNKLEEALQINALDCVKSCKYGVAMVSFYKHLIFKI